MTTAAHSASVRQCSGCGAQVELPPGAMSTRCGYCDAPLVDAARSTVSFDAVAPFRVDERVALERLRGYLAGRTWAPEAVRRAAVDRRSLRGVLVPFHVLDGVARSEWSAEVGVEWYETETYRDKDGKVQVRRVRRVEWFDASGTAVHRVEDHLVSASRGLPEAEANAIEPFDLGFAQPFDERWLAGFEAEVPSIGASEAGKVAAQELLDAASRSIAASLLPGDENRLREVSTQVEVGRRRMVLLPVWIAHYRHEGKPRRLLVNGQTGVVTGDVPTSVAKVMGAVFGGLLVAALLVWIAVTWGAR